MVDIRFYIMSLTEIWKNLIYTYINLFDGYEFVYNLPYNLFIS